MTYFFLLLCSIFMLYRFDKAVCFYVAFYPLISMVGVTNSINLFQVISILAFIAFICLNRHKYNNISIRFPFYTTLILVGISYFISNSLTKPHWPTTIAIFFSEYLFLIVFWEIMCNRDNRKIFFRYFFTFISIICLYCIFEFATQSNPLYEWYVNSSIFIGYNADRTEDIRFGSIRCHSIMRDVGAMGTVCCIAMCLIVSQLMNCYKDKKKTIQLWTILSLSAFCTLLTGTRTVILALFLCVTFFIFILNIKKKIQVMLVVAIAVIAFFDYFEQILLSFTDTQSVTGSSTNMRELQMAVVMNVVKQSPMYGLGMEGTETIINRYVEAYGLESVWFQTLINYGMLGAMALALSFIQSLYYSIRKRNIISVIVIAIFLLVKTMSSIPGIGNGYFLYIVVYLLMNNSNSYLKNGNRYYNNA